MNNEFTSILIDSLEKEFRVSNHMKALLCNHNYTIYLKQTEKHFNNWPP